MSRSCHKGRKVQAPRGTIKRTHAAVILVALGANLPHPDHGSPAATLRAALDRFPAAGIAVAACSRFFESPPVPAADQPWFVNAVARVETALDPAALLEALHGLEAAFGRVRRERWEARVLDLDLIDYEGRVVDGGPGPDLPHPRMADRGFVLLPLADVAPGWTHPVTGAALADLIAALDPAVPVRPLAEDPPIP